MLTRRVFLGSLAIASTGLRASVSFPSKRPPLEDRKLTSEAVEAKISEVKKAIADPELAWLFENCFPNTLDTTVRFGTLDGKPDTFVVTGDIDAMWLRDSSCQMWPYLPLLPRENLRPRSLVCGILSGRNGRGFPLLRYRIPAIEKGFRFKLRGLWLRKCFCVRIALAGVGARASGVVFSIIGRLNGVSLAWMPLAPALRKNV